MMKICFVAPNIYPVLANKKDIKLIGGAELQQCYIGRGLRDKGYSVFYVTSDYGQPDGEEIDGLVVLRTYKPNEGIFGIRFFFPRLHKTWKALKRAGADVYFVRSDTYLLGILAIFCKLYNKKLIFSAAHDTNFIPNEFRMKTKYRSVKIRDKHLFLYGLPRADRIIVQSEFQKKLLRDNFQLNCHIIRNFYPKKPVILPAEQRKYILWVATIRSWKRPIQFVNLAKAFPDEKFIMIGGRDPKDSHLYDEIRLHAERIKNLKFLGFQPLEVTETYFDRCKVFINTSKYEGFPNTFIQAWRRGIPVISYVDPDNVIHSKKLGRVVHTEEDLCRALSKTLLEDYRDSDHIHNYFLQNHSNKTIAKYALILESLISSPKSYSENA